MSITWVDTPIQQVLLAFASYSGTSIVPGSNVTGNVTADINDQPWDVALETILEGQGLVAREARVRDHPGRQHRGPQQP